MEHGPVLIISFQTQQIMIVRNLQGEIVEGDPVNKKCTLSDIVACDLLLTEI